MNTLLHWLLKGTNFLSALIFILIGTILVFYGAYEGFAALQTILFAESEEGKVISEVLKGLDIVFLGIVVQILGIGLFELFVKPIDSIPAWLNIKDFEQLKVLLVKASITVITISFVGKAVTWNGQENILYYGVGIGVIIAALSYFIRVKQAD